MSLPKPYYDHAGIVIYHGNCLDILPHLPKVDLVLTDPPYGIGFPYFSYKDTRENLSDCLASMMPIALNKADRVIALCGVTQTHLYPPPDWICCVTWNTTGSFGNYGYSQWMPVLCYGKDLVGFGNINGVTKSDTFRINGGASVGFMRGKDELEHTCPKPLNVMNWAVARFSLPSDTVIDPFMGSGTTLVAAKQLGRKAIGIELEEKYCEIAVRRLAQEVMDFGGSE